MASPSTLQVFIVLNLKSEEDNSVEHLSPRNIHQTLASAQAHRDQWVTQITEDNERLTLANLDEIKVCARYGCEAELAPLVPTDGIVVREATMVLCELPVFESESSYDEWGNYAGQHHTQIDTEQGYKFPDLKHGYPVADIMAAWKVNSLV
jgi:hypothetical protein